MIFSGGQTGVDRAALDVARALGLACGGFVPRGRRTEEGPLAEDYAGMTETKSAGYRARTIGNILAADATLVITRGEPDGGTLLALETARAKEKPVLLVDLAETAIDEAAAPVLAWLRAMPAGTLNVAGPRESRKPGIYGEARVLLEAVLGAL